MNYDEVMEIIGQSNKEDWIINDMLGKYTYKPDLNLHISRVEHEFDREFHEPWAEDHADPKAYFADFDIMYGASLVERRSLVSVDGHRALVPIPKTRTNLEVSSEAVNFALIVDNGTQTMTYILGCGLEIPPVS